MSEVEIRDVGGFKIYYESYDDYHFENDPFLVLTRKFKLEPTDSFLLEFGDNKGTNCLMFWVDKICGIVYKIKCFACDYLLEAELSFPEVEQNKWGGVSCFPGGRRDDGSEKSNKFQMSFNTKELDIVLDPQNTPDETMEIYVEGRVEYGIGYDNTLQYIRIKDLTPEEYAILKKYKTERPIEDFAPIAYLSSK